MVAKFLTDPVLVVLPHLAARLLQEDARPGHQEELGAPGDDLLDRHRAQHRRAAGSPATSTAAATASPARARPACSVFALAVLPMLAGHQGRRLGGGVADRPGRRGPPGLVGQPLHHRLRHVPQAGGGLGHRHRRDGRLDRRHAVPDRSPGSMLDKFKAAAATPPPAMPSCSPSAARAYLIAFGLTHVLAPRYEQVQPAPGVAAEACNGHHSGGTGSGVPDRPGHLVLPFAVSKEDRCALRSRACWLCWPWPAAVPAPR